MTGRITFSAYDAEDRLVVCGSCSTSDPQRDMHTAMAAWELADALRRGVAITAHQFCALVTGQEAPPSEADECMAALSALRADEGDAVRLGRTTDVVHEVVCCGRWTAYQDQSYSGPTLLAALQYAAAARQVATGRPTTAPGAPQQ